MLYLILALIAPIFVTLIYVYERHTITKQDETNAIVGILVFVTYLIFGQDIPDEKAVFISLFIAAVLCLIWLFFYALPWVEIAILTVIALLSLSRLVGEESGLGQFLIFLTASLTAFSILGLQVFSDSSRARYWRANWVQPSPIETKLGRDLVYEVPLVDSTISDRAPSRPNQENLTTPNFSKPETFLYPADPVQFKALLIQSKEAWVMLHKSDGQRDLHHWNASRFTEHSDVMNNLRSGYLRNWRKKGIVKAEIAIDRLDLV